MRVAHFVIDEDERHMATRSPPTGCARQNAAPLTFDSKPSEAGFSAGFSNFHKGQPEAAGDVISGVIGTRRHRCMCTLWRF